MSSSNNNKRFLTLLPIKKNFHLLKKIVSIYYKKLKKFPKPSKIKVQHFGNKKKVAPCSITVVGLIWYVGLDWF